MTNNNSRLTTHGEVDADGRRCLESLLADQVCRSADYRQATASTNALALRDCQQPLSAELLPRLYLADQQTAGRGRHGRSWHSGGGSLTFSLLTPWRLHSERPSNLLSIAVGVAIARAIEFACAPLRTSLKWPNDVYVDQGKVAGILIETNHGAADRVVIGVGINVNAAPALTELSSGTQTSGEQTSIVEPKSLAAVIGRPVARHELLATVLTHITATLAELGGAESAIIADFRARCLLSQQMIRFQAAGGECSGLCLGINDEGELAVKVGAQIHHCRSGEAHRLRLSGSPTSTPH
jgi:BirA family biotin operon repressor/biotin-[acetyl-CoA-carboxylase] ligase